MRASEMVRELLRQATPADSADSADTRARPSFRPLRMLADSCGRAPQAEQAPPFIRKHPQPSANMQTCVTPSDPQDSQVSQPTGCAITSEPDAAPRQQAGCNVLFLRRSVTCHGCAHQQRRPDTSDAGMHDCTKGHGLRYAYYPHDCHDWQPMHHVQPVVAP